RIKQDTAIGIMYTGIFAAGIFAVSLKSVGALIHIDIYHFIIGSVMAVSNNELWLIAIVSSLVLSSVILFFRPLQITSFDPVMAASIGIPVMAVDYLLTACTSLVVVSGVRVAGVILVVALIITPAATAYLLSDRLSRMIVIAASLGALGYWVGFGLALVFGASPGAAIVVTMTLIFVTTLIIAPKYGLLADWLRRIRMVPQEIKEDILGAIWRSEGQQIDVKDLFSRVHFSNRQIRQAIHSLVWQELLASEDETLSLTEKGEHEANRLIRAHRLWETYLTQTGMPKEQVHEKAHRLEHISDEATVDYLDDKLGHPLKDPHGSEIPDNRSRLISASLFKASLLREGDQATICEIGNSAKDAGLKIGDRLVAGQRSEDGQTWYFSIDHQNYEFNHDQADAILVQMVDSTSPH
ncbi:MAG: iron chelate uptake ABC transporter family permease subunit, partial [Planctomycetota bacterium]